MQKEPQGHDGTALPTNADALKSRSAAWAAAVMGADPVARQEDRTSPADEEEYVYDLFDLQDRGLVAA